MFNAPGPLNFYGLLRTRKLHDKISSGQKQRSSIYYFTGRTLQTVVCTFRKSKYKKTLQMFADRTTNIMSQR